MKPFATVVALVLAATQSACLFRARPDSFRYYTLATSTEPPVKSASGLTVGLGPVTLPGYLSRPGLVTRTNDTQVRYAEGERWAEPLRKQFSRTLSEDLSRALGGARIVDYAWYPSAPIDIAVAVNVLAFEVDTTGTATLNAGWALRDPKSRQVGSEGQSAIVEPAGGAPGEAKGDAAVAALSRALARLSGELAVAIVTNTRSRADQGRATRTGAGSSQREDRRSRSPKRRHSETARRKRSSIDSATFRHPSAPGRLPS